MSWDLIFWKGEPVAGRVASGPPAVWRQLADGGDVRFVAALSLEEVEVAFDTEFGADVMIAPSPYVDGLEFLGRGWECHAAKGDPYLHITCAWGLAEDDDSLGQLVRAGFRMGCTVFDPQAGAWWGPPGPDWTPASFDLWADAHE